MGREWTGQIAGFRFRDIDALDVVGEVHFPRIESVGNVWRAAPTDSSACVCRQTDYPLPGQGTGIGTPRGVTSDSMARLAFFRNGSLPMRMPVQGLPLHLRRQRTAGPICSEAHRSRAIPLVTCEGEACRFPAQDSAPASNKQERSESATEKGISKSQSVSTLLTTMVGYVSGVGAERAVLTGQGRSLAGNGAHVVAPGKQTDPKGVAVKVSVDGLTCSAATQGTSGALAFQIAMNDILAGTASAGKMAFSDPLVQGPKPADGAETAKVRITDSVGSSMGVSR